MRLLIDSSAQGALTADLQAAGHDVVSVASLWAEDPGDGGILERAFAEGRVVVTRDKDFGELAVFQGRPHCGIVRLAITKITQRFVVCQAVLTGYANELAAGAVITATPFSVRVRLPLVTKSGPDETTP